MRPNQSKQFYSELQTNDSFRHHHFRAMTNNAIITASCTCPVSNPVYFLLKIQIACTCIPRAQKKKYEGNTTNIH